MSIKPTRSDFEYSSQLDAFELYHLILSDDNRPSQRNGGPILPALGHALAGSVATATSKLVIYPLDLVIARLQVQKQLKSPKGGKSTNHEYKGLIDAATKIYGHEGGLSAFYTGCGADVTKGIADSFLFFLAYSFLQQRQLRRLPEGKKKMTVAQEMGVGVVAGAFSKLITTPLQNIITRQQTAALARAHDTESDDSLKKGDKQTVLGIARQIHKERGLAGFWTGYNLSLILTLNPAITFAVDNFLQKALRASDSAAYVTFLVAAVSKAVATTITYPISVAKSRAQARTGSTTDEKASNRTGSRSASSKLYQLLAAQFAVFSSMRNIYRRDGVSGLYSGIEAEVLKGFLSHGLTMMMKDRIHVGIIELYYALLKLTSNWPADLANAQSALADLATDARERVENISTTTLEAGKNLVSGTVDTSKELTRGLVQRTENIAEATTNLGRDAVAEVQRRGEAALEAGKDVAGDLQQRAENVGTTAYEAGKNVSDAVVDRVTAASTSTLEAGKAAAADLSERAGNIGTTAFEASKNVADATSSAASSSVEAGKAVVGDVGQRAANIGTTAVEAGKNAADAAVGQAGNVSVGTVEAVSDIRQRAENIGVTVVEAGKSAAGNIKK